MLSQNQPKERKLIIPIILILFLLGVFGASQLKRVNFFLEKEKIVSPVSPPTEEEKLEETLLMSGFKTWSIKSLDESFEATLSGNLFVLFSKEKEYASQVASLQFILSRSKIEGKIPQKIDLRFDKPVLTY